MRARFLQRALSVPLLGLFLHCQPGGPAAPADAGSPAPPDAAPATDAAVPAGWRIDPTVSGYAIWGTARDDVWIGSAGTFHHFDGSRWSRVPSPTTACVRGIWGSSRSDVWAVTSAVCPSYSQDVSRNGAEILHWDGSSWTSVVSRSDITLTAIGGSGPADLWAVGEALGTYTGVPALGRHRLEPRDPGRRPDEQGRTVPVRSLGQRPRGRVDRRQLRGPGALGRHDVDGYAATAGRRAGVVARAVGQRPEGRVGGGRGSGGALHEALTGCAGTAPLPDRERIAADARTGGARWLAEPGRLEPVRLRSQRTGRQQICK